MTTRHSLTSIGHSRISPDLPSTSSSSDSIATNESCAVDYQSAANSTENILQHLQGYLLRRNSNFIRKLSLQASSANTDFATFKKWVYQDLEKHRAQLQEAGSHLFFRNESKYDISKYDVVITFAAHVDAQLVDEFRRLLLHDHPSLNCQSRKHYFANYEQVALYVSASDDFFETYLHIAVGERVRPSSVDCSQYDDTPQYYPFTWACSSLHRQCILQCILSEWRFHASSDPSTNAPTEAPWPLLSAHLSAGAAPLDCLTQTKVIDQVFPLHHEEDLDLLKKSWVPRFFSAQPLDRICEYFGIKIAIYFAFLGFYTKYLIFPTFFGLFLTYFPMISWVFQLGAPKWLFCFSWTIEQDLLNDMFLFAFTIFNIFWSTIMLQKWEVSCKRYADRWSGLLPIELTSSLFKFTTAQHTSPESGPPQDCTLSRMLFKYCVTFPIIGCSLALTFSAMFHVFNFQIWWDKELIEKQTYPSWTRFLPKILLALIINCTNWLYYFIAVFLNDKERYCSFETKENNLILKLILFQFLNSFLPLLYIAFYLIDVDKLQEQLAAQLITRQVIGNFNESVWPFLKESYRIATRKMQNKDRRTHLKRQPSQGAEEDASLSKGELESCMYTYESTFDDYLELVTQFGYVMLFGPVFPLAALCAFLNNIIEIRSDAFKLCYVFQRPFGERTNSIGEWGNVLYYLSIVAIATNCALMAITGQISRLFGFHDSAHVILSSVVIEHSLLLIKWLIPNLI